MKSRDEATDATDCITTLAVLFDRHGALAYGEAVTQLEHAVQCAQFAQQSGGTAALIVACLLHDVGHLLHRDAAAALAAGNDDRHELIGARWLSRWFRDEVTAPIALHVDAKRYLVATDPEYGARLSPVSRRTLAIQGGPMTVDEARSFRDHPAATDAIMLRRCDDAGKQPGLVIAELSHYLALCRQCLR